MNQKLIKELRNHPGYFVHLDGFVFKVNGGKDLKLPVEYNETEHTIYVVINGDRKNVLYLIVEAFLPPIKQHQQVKHSVQKIGNTYVIPFNSIQITDFTSELTPEIANIIIKYKCRQRAESANSRSRLSITPVHIAECLKVYDFKCVYCSLDLHVKNWHLDHLTPLSKDGLNRFDNIVPACYRCNLMKRDQMPADFIKRCTIIASHCRTLDFS